MTLQNSEIQLYIEEANLLLRKLCDTYKLGHIAVKTEYFSGLQMLRPAKFSSDDNCIVINIHFLSKYEGIIYHEFRHYWQRENYPEVYRWWMVEHGALYEDFQNSYDKNGKRIAYLYCSLERDAIAFEKRSDGDEKALLDDPLDEVYWRKVLNENSVIREEG